MTKENSRITFYNIDQCGYYKRRCNDPEFGDLSEILNDLWKWVNSNGMKLGQTCTYEIGDYSPGYRTFCFDLVKDKATNTYLLTTWNEVPSSANKVASAKSLDPVGQAGINLTELPDDAIPGYGTYFWFLPEKKLLTTIQFQHNFNGRDNLEVYLQGFLAKFSSYVVMEQSNNGESNILGYRKNCSREPNNSLSPKFKSRLYKKAGQIDFIKNNYIRIRKIIRKETINFSVERELALWQTLLKGIGISNPTSSDTESERFKFELNHTPSENELEDIIDSWESNERSLTKWNDLGFKLEGETKPRWLSHSLARSEFPLAIERENDEIVNAPALLQQLIANQQDILSLLD
jgi:hypothetical protein